MGLTALEDIVLYLNANEPKGLYTKNIEAIKKELKINQILKEKQVNLSSISTNIKCGTSIDKLMEGNRFWCNLKMFELDENATEAERLEFSKKIEKMYLTKEEMELIVDWLKEE